MFRSPATRALSPGRANGTWPRGYSLLPRGEQAMERDRRVPPAARARCRSPRRRRAAAASAGRGVRPRLDALSPSLVGTVSEIIDVGDLLPRAATRACTAPPLRLGKGEPVDRSRRRRSSTSAASSRPQADRPGRRARRRPAASTSSTMRGSSRRWRCCAADPGAGQEIVGSARARRGGRDLVDRVEQIVFELGEYREDRATSRHPDAPKESFERITLLYEAGVDVTGVPAGFRESTCSPPASSRGTS